MTCASGRKKCASVDTKKIQKDVPPDCYVRKMQKKILDASWKDMNKITWVEVFSMQRLILYILFLSTTITLTFMGILLAYIMSIS